MKLGWRRGSEGQTVRGPKCDLRDLSFFPKNSSTPLMCFKRSLKVREGT